MTACYCCYRSSCDCLDFELGEGLSIFSCCSDHGLDSGNAKQGLRCSFETVEHIFEIFVWEEPSLF